MSYTLFGILFVTAFSVSSHGLHYRWYKARHGSLMVASASAGTAAVRKKDPAHYPAATHAYYRLADHELHAPLLCAACFERVEPNNLFQVCFLAYTHTAAFLSIHNF